MDAFACLGLRRVPAAADPPGLWTARPVERLAPAQAAAAAELRAHALAGRCVCVYGPSGIGKTVVARAALRGLPALELHPEAMAQAAPAADARTHALVDGLEAAVFEACWPAVQRLRPVVRSVTVVCCHAPSGARARHFDVLMQQPPQRRCEADAVLRGVCAARGAASGRVREINRALPYTNLYRAITLLQFELADRMDHCREVQQRLADVRLGRCMAGDDEYGGHDLAIALHAHALTWARTVDDAAAVTAALSASVVLPSRAYAAAAIARLALTRPRGEPAPLPPLVRLSYRRLRPRAADDLRFVAWLLRALRARGRAEDAARVCRALAIQPVARVELLRLGDWHHARRRPTGRAAALFLTP